MSSDTQVYDKKPIDFSPRLHVAATYVNVHGKILLLQLADHKSERGAWGVPAGKLETGEKPVQGAKRELLEETGIDIESESSFQFHGELYIRKPDIDYVYYIFSITLNNTPPIRLSAEHCLYQWVSREEAERLPLMNGAKFALNAYYK